MPSYNKVIPNKVVYNKHITQPQTPNVLKRYQMNNMRKLSQPDLSKDLCKLPKKLTNTQPLPFSFEARNEMLKQKKEEFIKKVYEEEKKAREFHARPIPKAVLHAHVAKNCPLVKTELKNKTVSTY